MTAQQYVDQVSLLVRAIPEIAREDIFALKGGTAINLFARWPADPKAMTSDLHHSHQQSVIGFSIWFD